MASEEREERGGLGRILRNIAIGIVVIMIALVTGFGTGYFLRDKKVQELQERLADQKEQFTVQVSSLEKQVLEAQKSQLEQALARARLQAGLEEVLKELTVAAAEVEQKNFGRAMQKIAAAKGALTAASNTPAAVRDAVSAKLDEITVRLKQLDVKVGEEIASLSKALEEGSVPGGKSKQ